MKTLFLVPLLMGLMFPLQNPPLSADGSAVVVLGFKWIRTRQTIKPEEARSITPAPEMLAMNKNYQKQARANDPRGARDPNEDTIDGRSAALEKINQQARTASPKSVDGYDYRVKIQNTSKKVMEIVFWEFQSIDPSNPANVAHRQFLCGVNVRPDKEKELQAFSLFGPTDVVNAQSAANASGNVSPDKVVINRVEFADGSIWQRKDWNFAEIKLTYQHAVSTPWNPNEMCRGL